MKTLFTVHAGEFVVGDEIERQIPNAVTWLPAKDTGIDLLVTNSRRTESASNQVKFSRDFRPIAHQSLFGWYKFPTKKILESKADLWVFVVQPLGPKQTQYILIPPKDLRRRLVTIHGRKQGFHIYLLVTEKGKCWQVRDIPQEEEILIENHAYTNEKRDFTRYLNA